MNNIKQLTLLAKQIYATEEQLNASIEGGICNVSHFHDEGPRIHVYLVKSLYKLFDEASALDPGHVILEDKQTDNNNFDRKISFTFDGVRFFAYTRTNDRK